jgi:hypothetical protein
VKKVVFAKSSRSTGTFVSDKELVDCFNALDLQRHGVLSPKELYKAFRRCGLRVSKAAMSSVMKDMGIDPTDEIDVRDFIRFFRRVQDLTAEVNNEKPIRCSTRCSLCLIFLALVSCCVFLMLIVNDETGNEKTLTGYKLGLISSASILGAMVLYWLLAQARRRLAPYLDACGKWCWEKITIKPPKEKDKMPDNVGNVLANARKKPVFSKAPRKPPAPIESYLKVEVRPAGAKQVPPSQALQVSAAAAQPTNTLDSPTKQYLRVNRQPQQTPEGSSRHQIIQQVAMPNGHHPHQRNTTQQIVQPYNQHSGASDHNSHHHGASKYIPPELVPYDPKAYEDAARMMSRARQVGVPTSTFSSASRPAVELATLPTRPGAAKRNENVTAQVITAFSAKGEPTEEEWNQLMAARRVMQQGGSGRPDTYRSGVADDWMPA